MTSGIPVDVPSLSSSVEQPLSDYLPKQILLIVIQYGIPRLRPQFMEGQTVWNNKLDIEHIALDSSCSSLFVNCYSCIEVFTLVVASENKVRIRYSRRLNLCEGIIDEQLQWHKGYLYALMRWAKEIKYLVCMRPSDGKIEVKKSLQGLPGTEFPFIFHGSFLIFDEEIWILTLNHIVIVDLLSFLTKRVVQTTLDLDFNYVVACRGRFVINSGHTPLIQSLPIPVDGELTSKSSWCPFDKYLCGRTGDKVVLCLAFWGGDSAVIVGFRERLIMYSSEGEILFDESCKFCFKSLAVGKDLAIGISERGDFYVLTWSGMQ